MGRRRGFTLIETMLAVVIVSLMSLMAFPRMRSSMIKTNLRGARAQVANMLAAARATATQGSRNTELIFNGNVARIEAWPRRIVAAGSNRDTVGTPANLNTMYGASVSLSTGDRVTYDPRGFATNTLAGVKISLTKNGYMDSVFVDRLGRVRK